MIERIGPRRTARVPRRAFVRLSAADGADVRGLRALLALRGLELDALVLFERLVAVARDGRVVDEDVRATAVRSDEAEALFVVEPLHSSLRHAVFLPARALMSVRVRHCA